jgi:gas vesicle structural protein
MSNHIALLGSSEDKETSLLEILDHVVNSGVVIQGSIIISLAGVDLIYLGLNVVLTSVENALRYIEHDRPRPARRPNKARKIKPA